MLEWSQNNGHRVADLWQSYALKGFVPSFRDLVEKQLRLYRLKNILVPSLGTRLLFLRFYQNNGPLQLLHDRLRLALLIRVFYNPKLRQYRPQKQWEYKA